MTLTRSPRSLLEELFAAALGAVEAERVTRSALEKLPLPAGSVLRALSVGKAAPRMAEATRQWADASALHLVRSLVVAASPADITAPDTRTTILSGDHPVPGDASIEAAERIASFIGESSVDDAVLVLLSGGATSAIAAPIDAIAADDLRATFEQLLASGLDIGAMNAVRKRCTRWGGGRLAAALAPRPTHLLAISDVPGDDLATIGSGPCSPDPRTASEVVSLLHAPGSLWGTLPRTVRAYLERAASGEEPETPKPGDAIFARVRTAVIATNRDARRTAARRASASGLDGISISDRPLAGNAADCGRQIARELLGARAMQRRAGAVRSQPMCIIWGGETVVTLGSGQGLGGRNQELALAAACELAAAGTAAEGITLLAAGTDGRDGPTDAAGAIVDAATCGAIRAAGRDPERDLSCHDSYRALDAAGALLRTGPTGTNVMDLAIGLVV